MLYVFSGLSGTGKSTLARALAHELGAVYLRIDRIEQALKDTPGAAPEIGEAGYRVAHALAEDQLHLGLSVVADAVNPLGIARRAWHAAAHRAGAGVADIEVICSDALQHRQRVETRHADIAGLRLPDWADVQSRHYEAWGDTPRIVIDTAGQSVAQNLQTLLLKLAPRRASG